MSEGAPVDGISKGPGNPRAPLIVTAELPADVLAWADGLRRQHFPPERNQLRAHVTLFHALPHFVEAELSEALAKLAREGPPPARIDHLLKLGGGTALAIECPRMVELHCDIAERMHGLLTQQDQQRPRLHITIQNKVTPATARALQAELAPQLHPVAFRFHGFGLYAYEGGPWRPIRVFPFRR
ncbi:hypothetical protein WSK_3955 [Novosphingobium sp. Rr 2-17]|uniref:2'-5' RNA ligase family protein n=1 Tax=Novosphingobium sp. Rr 2-17 TaxID=555793 RepID=UPI000269957C|nr:2'-5' RNA ligase family protein [Novosphingobium sp. Rr 2-17]EIZ77573.1 hypothetical protein WSK_3955 [Novosphingobium sp. Rr 2-17]